MRLTRCALPLWWIAMTLLPAHAGTLWRDLIPTPKQAEVAGKDWPLDPSPTHIELTATRWDLGTSDLDKIEIRRVGPMDDALI